MASLRDYGEIDRVFGHGGLLEQNQENYSVREGQIGMAKGCYDAFLDRELFIAEAGTGTGKTYAYLVPAILSGGKVVVSTATKNLQDQIFDKDIPKILEVLGADVSYCILKGLQNYLCLKKYDENKDDNLMLTLREKESLGSIVAQAMHEAGTAERGTSAGDLSRLSISRDSARLFSCHNSKQCTRNRCKYFENECFYYRARRRAAEADLVVINHALFFSSLQVEDRANNVSTLLPHYDTLIFDECHKLCEVGRNFYSQVYSSVGVAAVCREFLEQLHKKKVAFYSVFEKGVEKLLEANKRLGTYLQDMGAFKDRGSVSLPAVKYMEYDPRSPERPVVNMDFRDRTVEIYNAIMALSELVKKYGDQEPEAFEDFTEDMQGYLAALVNAMKNDRDKDLNRLETNFVAYVDLSRNGFGINLAPIYIGEEFGRELSALLASQVGVAMTSATVTVEQSFEKFCFDTFDNCIEPVTMVVPSIFNYREHACMLLSKEFPDTGDSGRIRSIVSQLREVIECVEGGIFFLTTTHRALLDAKLSLETLFEKKRRILWQGSGKSNAELVESFKQDGRAILVGTASFWEGMDVPGRALSMVIIDKLPFVPPDDPLFEAQKEKLEEKFGRDVSFGKIMLPGAILALRQGAGRLIRQEDDRGALVICDPRIVTRGYGRAFISSLPDMRICHDRATLKGFLQSIGGGP